MCDGLATSNRTNDPNDERCNWGVVSRKIGYFWEQFNKQNPVFLHRQMPSLKKNNNNNNHTLCSNLTPKFNNSKSENGSSNYSAKNQTFWGAKHFITHPNQFIHVGCFIIYMIKQSTQHNPTCEFSVSYLRVYLKSKGNMVTFFFLLTDR